MLPYNGLSVPTEAQELVRIHGPIGACQVAAFMQARAVGMMSKAFWASIIQYIQQTITIH